MTQHISRRSIFRAGGAAALTAGAILLAAGSPMAYAEPATGGSGTSPVEYTFTNLSGRGTVNVAFVGTVGEGSTIEGYLNAQGVLVPWPRNSTPTSIKAPDPTMFTLAEGESKTFLLPYWFSGRGWYSWGGPMPLRYVGTIDGRTSTVQPVPWVPGGEDAKVDFDFVELTYSQWGLYNNSTQVDMISTPAVVEGVGENSGITGGIVPGGWDRIVQGISALPAFRSSIQRSASGDILRILNPMHAAPHDEALAKYLDPFIDRAWKVYETRDLRIIPDPQYNPDLVYTGRVKGGVFSFKNSRTGGITEIKKPTTIDALSAAGALVAGPERDRGADEHSRGILARTISAAINRGTLGTSDVEPIWDPTKFYQQNAVNGGLMNHFARLMHENMPGGKAYGFSFDDVAGQESLIHIVKPKSLKVTIIDRSKGIVYADRSPVPAPSPEAPTTPPVTPVDSNPGTPGGSADASAQIVVPAGHPGWATITLGAGTTAGLITTFVDGKQVSVASVGGAGDVRVDLPASPGARAVTVRPSGTGTVGPVQVTLPGGSSSSNGPTAPPAETAPAEPAPTEPAASTSSTTTSVKIPSKPQGYGTITFGPGTTGGLVKIAVAGGSTSTVAVTGPGPVRADISGSAGTTQKVTVTSSGKLGKVSITVA